MTLRQYLILVSMGSGLAWITWLVVLFMVNPFEAGFIGFFLFYIALAIALIGTVSLLGFAVRYLMYRHERVMLREVTTAFRESLLLTIVVIGSLLLQSKSLLAWWNVLLFVILVSIIELFCLSSRLSS